MMLLGTGTETPSVQLLVDVYFDSSLILSLSRARLDVRNGMYSYKPL